MVSTHFYRHNRNLASHPACFWSCCRYRSCIVSSNRLDFRSRKTSSHPFSLTHAESCTQTEPPRSNEHIKSVLDRRENVKITQQTQHTREWEHTSKCSPVFIYTGRHTNQCSQNRLKRKPLTQASRWMDLQSSMPNGFFWYDSTAQNKVWCIYAI